MIKAEEAKRISEKIKFANINPEEQYNDVSDWVNKAINRGEGYVRYKEELHPDVRTRLENDGYRVVSAGLNSSSKFHDAIYW